MANRAATFILWILVGGVSALALLHSSDRRVRTVGGDPPGGGICRSMDPPVAGPSSHPYGKIRLPADVSIGLAQTDGVAGPLTITVSVSSLVAVDSGVLTLRIPEVAGEPNRTEVLWAGTPHDFVTQTATYHLQAPPVGRYCFAAVFEFMPAGDDAREVALSDSLYMDVRPDAILTSNVSFDQIKRLELRRELERRIVRSLKPGITIASEEDTTRELARLEAADPGFVARKMAEIRATDPDIARRVLELNECLSEPMEDAGVRADQPTAAGRGWK